MYKERKRKKKKDKEESTTLGTVQEKANSRKEYTNELDPAQSVENPIDNDNQQRGVDVVQRYGM